jgi:hypothetical protein
MGYTGEISHNAASSLMRYHTQKILDNSKRLKEANRDISYYGRLIMANREHMYDNPVLTALFNNKSLDHIKLSRVDYDKIIQPVPFIKGNIPTEYNNKYSAYLKNGKYRDIINVYMYGFVNSYKKKVAISKEIIESNKFLQVKHETLVYIIRRYFLQVQIHLLTGGSYKFPGIGATIKIYGKHKRKAKYNYQVLRPTVDWGASFKYLIEQSEHLDKETFDLYKKKYITKSDFIRKMRPFLYSYTNPKGLKWLLYSEKNFDLWLVLRTNLRKLDQLRMYSIVPTNFINNLSKSQIDFTNNVKDISEIIETELLGFRDKIRAMERYDMEYCLKTFDNDIKYNKQ